MEAAIEEDEFNFLADEADEVNGDEENEGSTRAAIEDDDDDDLL